MSKLIASLFISLDGYIVGPNEDMSWVIDNFNDEMGVYQDKLQASMGAILLGRVTYEIMANYWPTADDVSGAEKMNSTPKVVFSKTLDKVVWGEWNTARLAKDNVVQEILEMKQLPEKDMVIYGSGNLVSSLTQHGLIDEYHLLVHPVILGGGKRLFSDITEQVDLKLLRTESFKNGVVVLYYAPQRS